MKSDPLLPLAHGIVVSCSRPKTSTASYYGMDHKGEGKR